VMVGRVPNVDDAWWHASAQRPRMREPLVWIALGASNGFTRVLHDQLLTELETLLEVDRVTVQRTPTADAMLVVVLDHGAAEPLGVPATAGLHQRLLESVTPGSIVVHFGCFGAGRAGGDRYVGLLGIERRDAVESISSFALDCLARGASAVIGHVDGTWSGTYVDPRPVAEVVRHLAAGVSAGYATRLLTIEAQRHAACAVAMRTNDPRRAGQHWLRHLDLSGYVCLGDPCSRLRPLERED
jgi:hypothetical protein